MNLQNLRAPHYVGVPSCPGYFVNAVGQVVSTHPRYNRKSGQSEWRELSGWLRNGYRAVNIKTPEGMKSKLVHVLIMEAFAGPKLGRMVNHKDGNKQNNNLSNLEYVTAAENVQHAWDMGLNENARKSNLTKNKFLNPEGFAFNAALTREQVKEIRKLLGSKSQAEIAREYGVAKSAITRIKLNQTYRETV